jgi:hypothetical protein
LLSSIISNSSSIGLKGLGAGGIDEIIEAVGLKNEPLNRKGILRFSLSGDFCDFYLYTKL